MTAGDRRGLAAVLALTALGLALRAVPVGTWPLWVDEAATWTASGRRLAAFLTWDHHPDHPPLSFLLVRASRTLFATDAEWALRLPSLVAGALAIPAGWLLGRAAGSTRLGLLFALPLALDPLLVDQGRQARMYTLLVLFTVLAWERLARLEREPGSRAGWALLGLALAGAAASHALGLVAWGAIVLGVGAAALGDRAGRRGAAAGLLLASVVALLLLGGGVDEWAAGVLGGGSTGPSVRPGDAVDAFASRFRGAPWLLVAGPLLALGAAVGLFRLAARARWVAGAVVATALLSVPAVVVAVMGRPYGLGRFGILARVALYLGLAALGALDPRPWVRRAGVAAVALASVAGLVSALRFARPPEHDAGEVVRRMAALRRPGDAAIFVPHWFGKLGAYYGVPPDPEFAAALDWGVPPIWPYDRTWVFVGRGFAKDAPELDRLPELARAHRAPLDAPALLERMGSEHAFAIRLESGRVEVLEP